MFRLLRSVILLFFISLFLFSCNDAAEKEVQETPSVMGMDILRDSTSMDVLTEEECGIQQDTGYFYTLWLDKQKGSPYGDMSMLLLPHMFYAEWNNVHGVLFGKGLETGNREIAMNIGGYGNLGSRGFCAIYGWAEDNYNENDKESLIEYYIVLRWTGDKGYGDSSDGTAAYSCGSFTSRDGYTYDLYKSYRYNKPSIKHASDSTFTQYWSVRRGGDANGAAYFTIGGKVYFKDHVNAWESATYVDPKDGTKKVLRPLSKMNRGMGVDNGKNYPGTYLTLIVEGAYEYGTGSGWAYLGFGSIEDESKAAPPGYYRLIDKWSNKAIAVINNSEYSDIVTQNVNSGSLSQQWVLGEITGGPASVGATVRIRNKSSNKYLTVVDQSDYADVKGQSLNTSWASQEWVIEGGSLHAARLRNVWSGKYLTVTNTNAGADIRCQQLNSSWASQIWDICWP